MKPLRKRVRNSAWDDTYLAFRDHVGYNLWMMAMRDVTSRVSMSEGLAEIVMDKMYDYDSRSY